MVEKKILLVGDGNHQFITNYAKWLCKDEEDKFQIDILSSTSVKERNKVFYKHIFEIKKKLFFNYLNRVRGVRKYYRLFQYDRILNNIGQYDFVHFHFISTDSYFIVKQIKKNTIAKIIMSIWGSDMYRLKLSNEKKFIDTCKRADYITFTNQKSLDYFKSKYSWTNSNLLVCRFGLAPLESLKQLPETKKECKQKLDWDSEKLALTIGYNLNPAQQHIEILNQFELDEMKALNDKILLVLPITYGGTEQYKKLLLKKIAQVGIEYVAYDTFLTDNEVAQIRKASDIMVQLQITDQFSGSMQEHLYANNVVITGSWLPYETMKEYGVKFEEIQKVEDLAKLLVDVINNYQKYQERTTNNQKAILKLSSWDKNIEEWKLLYTY